MDEKSAPPRRRLPKHKWLRHFIVAVLTFLLFPLFAEVFAAVNNIVGGVISNQLNIPLPVDLIVLGATVLLAAVLAVVRRRLEETPTEKDGVGLANYDESKREATKRLRSIESARRSPHLYSYLRWKYASEPIFERGGFTFPVAAWRAPLSQRTDPDTVRGPLINRFLEEGTLFKDAELRELMERAGRVVQNRVTFALDTLEVGTALRLNCHMGKYVDMLETCESLEWETLNAAASLQGATEQDFQRFDRRLKLRARLHAAVPNPVRSGAHRSATVSLSALTAFYHDGGVQLLMRKRSEEVATDPGMLHIIPSFVVQPVTLQVHDEYSLRHNLYREYLEELFDLPDPKKNETNPKYFYEHPALEELRSMLDNGSAEWYFVGVAVNLLTLRPEVCTVLLIKDEGWYERHATTSDKQQHFEFNFEYANAMQELHNDVQLVSYVPLKATDEEMAEYIDVRPGTIVPFGAFSFWAGVDLLRLLPEVRSRIE